jgi:GxxExxY protein
MTLPDTPLNRTTGVVLSAALEVHTVLGPGLLEHLYAECLARELRARGCEVQQQLPVPLVYKGQLLEHTYRLDMVVERDVVVEVKAVHKLLPVHEAQLKSYLRLTGIRAGLLLNFHGLTMREGIRRVSLVRA